MKRNWGTAAFGLALILVGAFIWAYRMGWVETIRLSLIAAVLMIVIGVGRGFDAVRRGSVPAGPTALFTAGVLLLLEDLQLFDLGASWPFILIAVGVVVVLGALRENSAGSS